MKRFLWLAAFALFLIPLSLTVGSAIASQMRDIAPSCLSAAPNQFQLCDIGQTYTQISPYSASEIVITNNHASDPLVVKVNFYWSHGPCWPDVVNCSPFITNPIPPGGQKIFDLSTLSDPNDPSSFIHGTFHVRVQSQSTVKNQPPNTNFTVTNETQEADSSLPYAGSYIAISGNEVSATASLSEVYNGANRNGQTWWSEIVVQNLTSITNTVTIALTPAGGGSVLSNNSALIPGNSSRVFLVNHLAFDTNRNPISGTFVASINGTGNLAVMANHYTLSGGQTNSLEQVRQSGSGGLDAIRYLPFVGAPNVEFAWDTAQLPGLPGADYGLPLNRGIIRGYEDTPEWVVDKNWYHWSINVVNNCNDTRFIPMVWAFKASLANLPDRIVIPSNCTGRPLLLANEPDLAGQANMTIDELARMTYVYRDWLGELYSPAFYCFSRTNNSPNYDYRCPNNAVYFDNLRVIYEESGRWQQGASWLLPYDGLAMHVYLQESTWDDYYPELPEIMDEWKVFAQNRNMDIMITEYGIEPHTMTEAGSKELRIARKIADLTEALETGLGTPLRKLMWFMHFGSSIGTGWSHTNLFEYHNAAPPNLECNYIINGECQPKSPVGTTWTSWAGSHDEASLPWVDAFTADDKLWTYDASYFHVPWLENSGNPNVTNTLALIYPYGNTPCVANPNPGTACTFGTRAVTLNPDGTRVESITAYGKYWNFYRNSSNDYIPLAGNGGALTSVERYYDQDGVVLGPCNANPNPGTPCNFDTRDVIASTQVESITAYGKYWNFDIANEYALLPGSGNDLTSVERYYDQDGVELRPCNANPNPGTPCTFDTREIFTNSAGTPLVEKITAYGKYWNFDITNNHQPLPGSGSFLTSIGYYASGPCAANPNPGTVCTFDSHDIVVNPDGTWVESITAYGKYWNFNQNNGLLNTGFLTDVLRYGNVPCRDPQTFGACNLDTRSIIVGGNGHLLESITAHGRYWNFDIDEGYLPLSGSGDLLTSVTRYATGPCAANPNRGTPCVFDSRETFTDPNTGTKVEFITAYGSYWEFHNGTLSSSGLLTSKPWYNSGPCAANPNPGTPCTFDTYYAYWPLLGHKSEFITAYNRYWIFNYVSFPPQVETGLLDNNALSIPAGAPGPCPAAEADPANPSTLCTLDTHTQFNIGW